MLTGRATRRALVTVGLVCLAACGSEVRGSPFEFPAEAVVLVPFDAMTTDHCLADSVPVDRMVQTVDCSFEGTVQVVAVERMGDDAPTDAVSPAVAAGYAEDACFPHYDAWASDNGYQDAGFLRVTVSDETWAGPDTPVVCGVRA